jgi:preprotein translocase subunit SecG
MTTFLIGLHIVVSIALIVIVLLQMGKGAQAGASFGAGGSQAQFGSTGGNFMSKVTVGAAVVFMLTSLTLAYFYTSPTAKTMMPSSIEVPATQAPTPEQK